MARRNILTGAKWEPIVGYSRAVRVGNQVYVSGTTAWNENGEVVGPGDPYAQTHQILKNIQSALEKAGATMSHVVRTRIFVTNILEWDKVARAHSEFFREILPATTMVQISRLIDPAMVVEIEAEAVIDE